MTEGRVRLPDQFAGMGVVEIRRLKQLEESTNLRRLVADLNLDKTMLQDVLRKMVRPGVRRDVVGVLRGAYDVSERRACAAMGFGRSAHRYRSRRDPRVALRMRLRDLAAVRVRYGYRPLLVLLRREGWSLNHRKAYRLYVEEGLSICTKVPRRKRAWRCRQGRPEVGGVNEVWSMDFMSDQLFDGRSFRVLTGLDVHA